MRRLAIAAGLALALSVFAQQAPPPASDDVISIERTRCFGTCPQYVVEVHASGKVHYEGLGIQRPGAASHPPVKKDYTIDPAAVKDLFLEAEHIHFAELNDKYRCVKADNGQMMTMTDLPTTFVRVVRQGKEKKVEAYIAAPDELIGFVTHVERVANVKPLVAPDGDLPDYPFSRSSGPFGTTGVPCEDKQ